MEPTLSLLHCPIEKFADNSFVHLRANDYLRGTRACEPTGDTPVDIFPYLFVLDEDSKWNKARAPDLLRENQKKTFQQWRQDHTEYNFTISSNYKDTKIIRPGIYFGTPVKKRLSSSI